MTQEMYKYLWSIDENTTFKEAKLYFFEHFGVDLIYNVFVGYKRNNAKCKDATDIVIVKNKHGRLIRKHKNLATFKYGFDIDNYIKKLSATFNYQQIQEILKNEKGIELGISTIQKYCMSKREIRDNTIHKSSRISIAAKRYKELHPEYDCQKGVVVCLDNDITNLNEENLLFVERRFAKEFFKYDIKNLSPEEKKTALLTIQINNKIKECETIMGKNKNLSKERQERQDNILRLIQQGYTGTQIAKELNINNSEVTFYRRRLKALGLLK